MQVDVLLFHGRGGRCGLVSDGCTLACMHAILHAGYRKVGLGRENAYAEYTVYNPRITMYIESGACNGSAAFD